MSNFSGVTFAEQKVTPSDDAIVRREILPDGILTGCRLTYSGSTLTMAAGFLLVCGRQIRHTASDNWPVADATSGYARLVLTIDLTLAATKDTFSQVTTEIQYATSVNGFSSLTQGDINDAASKYQVAICVVSLGSGGITGIVSQLASCSDGLLSKAVEAARENLTLTGLLKRKMVWENGDPASGFGAASVICTAAEGLNVIAWDVVYIQAAGALATTMSLTVPYDAAGHRMTSVQYSNSVNALVRQCAQSGTTFDFEVARANGVEYPTALVPVRIYAIYLNQEE